MQKNRTIQGQVAHNIKLIRKSHDWTQNDLAERCHYSRTYIGKIERCRKTPSLEALIRIANAFELQIGELFGCILPEEALGRLRDHRYLVGVVDRSGTVEMCDVIPEKPGVPVPDPGESLWSLPFLTPPVVATVREHFLEVFETNTAHTFHLHDSSTAGEEKDCDLVLTPLVEQELQERASFSLFWPHCNDVSGRAYDRAEPVC